MSNNGVEVNTTADPPFVDLTARLTSAGVASWEAIGELAQVVPRDQWAVVGQIDLVFLLGIAWTQDTRPMAVTMGKNDRKRLRTAMDRIDRDERFPWIGPDQQIEVRSAVIDLLDS